MAGKKKSKGEKKKGITVEGIGDVIKGGNQERQNYSKTLHRKKH